MKNLLFVLVSVVTFFIAQNIFHELFGRWFNPNLLVLLIVFFNLFRGIRYSLLTAFFAGIIMDSFSSHAFGIHLFSFMLCAYLTTIIKMYIYHPGSVPLRIVMVFLISLINVIINFFFINMSATAGFGEVFFHILIPEVLATTFLTNLVFNKLKQCALNFFV